MRDLVQKLPSGNPQHDQGTSDDTIAAVLATLNEVIKKNAEFARYFIVFMSNFVITQCSVSQSGIELCRGAMEGLIGVFINSYLSFLHKYT